MNKIEKLIKDLSEGMVNKDKELLGKVLADDFVLVHMTGMQQSKNEFVGAVLNGTLNYYSVNIQSLDVLEESKNETVVDNKSLVNAAVFGGGKHTWRLRQVCTIRKNNEDCKVVKAVASTY